MSTAGQTTRLRRRLRRDLSAVLPGTFLRERGSNALATLVASLLRSGPDKQITLGGASAARQRLGGSATSAFFYNLHQV
jgi:hypothetical protein